MARASAEDGDTLSTQAQGEPGEKTLFIVGLSAALAVLLVIMMPMALGQLYTFDDLSRYHIPMRAFYAKCLASGDSFTWNPQVYCGYYIHGEGQVGMYHPLHLFLYRYLPFAEAFNLELVLSYPIMLWGMYVFLRRRGLRRDAAIFGGIAFSFSGFNMLHFIHMNAVATLAHLPWALAAIDIVIRDKGPRAVAAAGGLALLTASQVLLGYPQYAWFSGLAEGLYALLLIRSWSGATLPLLLGAKICGAGIGAVQLAPTVETFLMSARNAASYEKDDFSLPLVNSVQMIGPYLFKGRVVTNHPTANTHEYGMYPGAVTALLFAWAAVRARRMGSHKALVVGAAALAAAAFVLSLGRFGGLYTVLSKAPLVGWFRAPSRYVGLMQFGMAVGAGGGV